MLDFNQKPPSIIHIDLNSCFATIEQQANPLLRGKPIVVAAYDSPNGCILAASIEAKKLGIKTGMRVKEGKVLYPKLIVLKPDPWKYRHVHLALRKLLSDYTYNLQPKSIDEFVLNLYGYPAMKMGLWATSLEIKKRIKEEIGDYLTVSIGIAPNRFLAKLASNMQKPDGLIEINKSNFVASFSKLKLTDLPYIKDRNALRLQGVGINSVWDFYMSPLWKLRAAFRSINAYYWHMRLHGFEVDEVNWGRRSYGNSYALPKPFSTKPEILPILSKLVTKMSGRVRNAGYKVQGVHLGLFYRDGSFWHKGVSLPEAIFTTSDIFAVAARLFDMSMGSEPVFKPIRNIAVSSFNLVKSDTLQLKLFQDVKKSLDLSRSLDKVNRRWGDFVVTPARMIDTQKFVPDRIAFGGVKELEEFTLENSKF